MAAASRPSFEIPDATASARVPLRSAMTTAAPSPARRRAVAAPIPEPAAVTTATWPANRPSIARVLDDPVTAHGRLVELEPEAGPLRRDELAALDPRHRSQDARRARHVLDHVAVRDGREQMHLN